MKSSAKMCLLSGAICFGLAASARAATDVSITLQGNERRVVAAKYEAVVGADGCMPHLKVAGLEFFRSAPSFPRGAYVYQGGLLKLPAIEQPGDSVVAAKGDKAAVRYDFGPDTITWTVTNLTPKRMLCLIVFDKGVSAVTDDAGWCTKTPAAFRCQTSTWFRDKASLRVAGGTRVWGPWGDGLQVWESRIGPKAAHKIVLQVDVATQDEIAKAAQVAAAPPPPPPTDPVGPMWDLAALSKPPAVYPAEGFDAKGMKAIFYGGRPFRGSPTRVFAWLGVPKPERGRKVPGMVLVHGGGGTAFDTWVRLWNQRGYAAIAMDTCGCTPGGKHGLRPHHQFGGPQGWGGYHQIDKPREDQWAYHAVADAVLANSLLRSLPEVDPERIGLTGISWGGYLTCIIAGVDPRFKFAVPVYGCGYTLDMAFARSVTALGKEKADRWMRWWDPSAYLKDAAMPMLWVTGSNDFAYTFNALQKSYRLPTGPRTLCIRLRMPHGHGPAGEGPKEIHALADSILKAGKPLAKVTGQGRDGAEVWATFESKVPVVRAELNITRDKGRWQDRKWDALPAKVGPAGKVAATLPEGVTVYYLNLIDERDLVVSTEHVELAP